ncbi:MAG: hypothetical protein ACMXYL_03475 [Candidatus Woesearchaeota archaeon]
MVSYDDSNFEIKFIETYAPMYHEIALGMIDYRESEEPITKLAEYEIYNKELFDKSSVSLDSIDNNNIRRMLSFASPFDVILAYYMGMVDEDIAVMRAGDYGTTGIIGNELHYATLLELGLAKSTHPTIIRENAGELSQKYKIEGFTFPEIIALTTIVPPDNPTTEKIGLERLIRAQ